MSRHEEATTQRSDGVFAAHNGPVDAENEPILTARDGSPHSARRQRSLSGSSSSSSRPSRVGVVRASNVAVGSRLLHALPPRWSQWLQPRTAESAPNSASHGARRRPSPPPPPPTATAAAASASTLHVPVTLRVLPGNAPRLAVAPRPPPTSSLHEIRIDTTRHNHDDVNDDDEADDDGSLPALVSLTDVNGSPLASPSQRQHPPSSEPAISPAGSPRSTASSDDTSQSEELSTFDEFQTLFRRCHHTLPFVALFGLYFVYQHLTGLAVFAVGSVAIAGLDQRLRAQIALKENANALYLVGIIAICVVDTIVVSSLGGEPNPFKHLAFKLSQPATDEKSATAATPHGALVLELLWIVLVNDFIVRLWSLAVKALVALVPSDVVLCGWRVGRRASVAAGSPVSPNQDLEDGMRRKLARSNVAFYRRKRKLYGIIELTSIFFRSLLAGLPWCSYYQVCGSKFMADVFTFLYVFGKSVILGSQGRRLVKLVRSFLTLGLEHATYATRDELVEAGSPDCSICYESMQAPVKLSCAHLFCEECVMEWFDRDRSCPLCRVAIVPTSQANGEPKPQFLDGSTSLFPQLF